MSSSPLRRQRLRNASTSKCTFSPSGRLIKHEIRVLRPVRAKPDLFEQPLREAGPFDRLQIDRRKYLVGVEVDDRQRRRDTGQLSEFFHFISLPKRNRAYACLPHPEE